jgi:hypothetical protein
VLSLKLTGRLPDVKAHTFMMLKEVHDFREIVGVRIAGWSEHAHEAFRRNVRGLSQAGEANGRVDVVARNCLCQSDIVGQILGRLMVGSPRELNPRGDPTRAAAIIPKLFDRILAPR